MCRFSLSSGQFRASFGVRMRRLVAEYESSVSAFEAAILSFVASTSSRPRGAHHGRVATITTNREALIASSW